jgi:hypothetical protein
VTLHREVTEGFAKIEGVKMTTYLVAYDKDKDF